MATRRARIKGIANIPIRRRADIQPPENEVKPSLTNSESEESKIPELPAKTETNLTETKPANHHTETNEETPQTYVSTEVNISETEQIKNVPVESEVSKPAVKIPTLLKKEINNSGTEPLKNSESEPLKNTQAEPKVSRRWLPKPAVKIPVGNRREKNTVSVDQVTTEKTDSSIKSKGENGSLLLKSPSITSETLIQETSPSNHVTNKLAPPVNVTDKLFITENHPHNSQPIPLISTEKPEPLVNKLQPVSTSTDSLVNKSINRARIRPMPKLIRRSSVHGSASESEDDNRRHRNDSVASIPEVITTKSDEVVIERVVKVQKTMRRSELWRKVLDAKKEFSRKFGSKLPDRKRLTMMDLIYYNPTTNPMPQRVQRTNSTTKDELIFPKADENLKPEEDADDPDGEDSNPVPQVKVGPNGEIILDEQSLVIEQTGLKKSREELKNSEIISADDENRAYGIYKRLKRSKDWPVTETLRFYRTLNTVGTDFSLMLSLFPGRTRRELKMKFKKEERSNKVLIDKVLLNPMNFDLTDLEEQLQHELQTGEKKKKSRKEAKPRTVRQKTKRYSLLASQMEEERESKSIERKARKRRSNDKTDDLYSVLKKPLSNVLSSDSESEEEVIIKRRIRSVRAVSIPKENTEDAEEEDYVGEIEDGENSTISEEQMDCAAENQDSEDSDCKSPAVLPNLSHVEPGSLMVLTSVTPEGQQICKVFMVTPGQAKVPVNLSSDAVQALTSNLANTIPVNINTGLSSTTNDDKLNS